MVSRSRSRVLIVRARLQPYPAPTRLEGWQTTLCDSNGQPPSPSPDLEHPIVYPTNASPPIPMASMLFDSLPYDASPFARTSFQSDLSSSFGDEAEYEAYEYNHERGGAAPAPVSSAATSGGPASEASPTLPDDIDVFRPAQSVPPGQRLMTSYMMADKAGSGGTRTGKGMHKMQYSHPQQQQHQR